MKDKFLIVIQARMGSSRLPGKVLMPFCGVPMLKFQLDLLKKYDLSDKIIIATSEHEQDDQIEDFAIANGVNVVRGSELNVFSRFKMIAENTEVQNLVRLTGDNPLINYLVLNTCITSHKSGGYDFTSTRVVNEDQSIDRFVPKGQSVDIMSCEVFKSIDESKLTEFDKEHVIPVFFRMPLRRNIMKEISLSEKSLSIDSQEDLNEIEALTKALIRENKLYSFLNYS